MRGKEHKECRTHPAATGGGKGSIKGDIGIWHIKSLTVFQGRYQETHENLR